MLAITTTLCSMKLTYIDMLNGLRLGRAAQYQPSLTSFPIPNSNRISPPSFVRFLQSAPSTTGEMDSTKHNSSEPERQSPPESKTVDTMSSYGEGYATRSDEEGFGGIYGGNQYFNKDNEDKKVDEVEHDEGSHVKETEKARNQVKGE